jgi:hypothetical protein
LATCLETPPSTAGNLLILRFAVVLLYIKCDLN